MSTTWKSRLRLRQTSDKMGKTCFRRKFRSIAVSVNVELVNKRTMVRDRDTEPSGTLPLKSCTSIASSKGDFGSSFNAFILLRNSIIVASTPLSISIASRSSGPDAKLGSRTFGSGTASDVRTKGLRMTAELFGAGFGGETEGLLDAALVDAARALAAGSLAAGAPAAGAPAAGAPAAEVAEVAPEVAPACVDWSQPMNEVQ
mmetsp:Transcript_13787/g.31990  ORF Transcript_13787/g.31990 Transcript_13787/m.31990 type:complete len:202 (-) Transcript_13787:15-620(-)